MRVSLDSRSNNFSVSESAEQIYFQNTLIADFRLGVSASTSALGFGDESGETEGYEDYITTDCKSRWETFHVRIHQL